MRKTPGKKKIASNLKKFVERKLTLDLDEDNFLQTGAFVAGILFQLDEPDVATDLAFAFCEHEHYRVHAELVKLLVSERVLFGTEGDLTDVVQKFLEENNINDEGGDDEI